MPARAGYAWTRTRAPAWPTWERFRNRRSTLIPCLSPPTPQLSNRFISPMQHRTRAIWILIFLACGFTVISFNLIQIQLVEHDKFWRMAVENHTHPEAIPPQRGSFFDSDGMILAQTRRVDDICLDGQLMNADHPEINLPKIAQVLQVPEEPFAKAFNPRKR